ATRWHQLERWHKETLAVADNDESLDLLKVRTRRGDFWVQRNGTHWDGTQLLAYLLTEHQMFAEKASAGYVRRGDVVVDCGAHIGVFTRFALDAGASRVVAIEPDPANLECLRRNMAGDSRVTVIPKAVWSEETGTLELLIAANNSGSNRVVGSHGANTIRVAATTLDNIEKDLRLTRVDFIKLDIEGAERHALKGASRMLSPSSSREGRGLS
ncbi:MAG TPA: FkbM family methyltransferase, partial [Bryobacteraceae bacterium]|nr:FkbM family methyltransferase [Bryobacteraceae bacterium]